MCFRWFCMQINIWAEEPVVIVIRIHYLFKTNSLVKLFLWYILRLPSFRIWRWVGILSHSKAMSYVSRTKSSIKVSILCSRYRKNWLDCPLLISRFRKEIILVSKIPARLSGPLSLLFDEYRLFLWLGGKPERTSRSSANANYKWN
jgi:hypothetical protein